MIWHDPCHRGVPSGASKTIFWSYGMFRANRAPIMSQDYHYLQTDRNELPLEPRQLGVPSGASKMISEQWYVWRKPCTYLAVKLTPSLNWSKRGSTWPTSPRSSIGCIQNDFPILWYIRGKPCTYLASTLALSPNRASFHLSLVT